MIQIHQRLTDWSDNSFGKSMLQFRRRMKQDHFLLLLLLFLNLLFLQSLSEKSNGMCVSPGGRFQPFSSERKPPRKVRDLTLCRVFQRRTCCDVSHTHSALLSTRRLASTGEANQECLHLWELLECSICDPNVGVNPGPPVICTSFCERLHQACSGAYFSMDAITQVLLPCGVSDFICGRASEWIRNGTELCRAAGFSVSPVRDSGLSFEEKSCYGGKASLDSIADSWKTSQTGTFHRDGKFSSRHDFQRWVTEMPFTERISWAIGGLVLAAGFRFMSRRRQNRAAIVRAARIKATAQRSPTTNTYRNGSLRQDRRF